MSDNYTKQIMHQICNDLVKNIAQCANFYDNPFNTSDDYATYMIETITKEYSKTSQALLTLKNTESGDDMHDPEVIPEEPYVTV